MVGRLLRTLASRFLLLVIMILFAVPVLIYTLLPARWRYNSKLFYGITHLFYLAVLKCSFLPIEYVGLENVPQEPVIFTANHQSSFDIPLVGKLAGGTSHVWLALAYLMKAPMLRFILPHVAVLVDTSTPWKAVRSLLQVIDLVKKHKLHIMIFPEGGRYTDDRIHDFFGGFAILAKRTARPVVPVYIHGINKVYPPNAFLVRQHPVKVIVGKPFIYKEKESDELFKQRVYQWFVEQAEKCRR